MAPVEETSLQQVDENMCSYCKKKVEDAVICVKCSEIFHPKCLKQSAGRKSAVCVHVAAATIPTAVQQKRGRDCECREKEVEIQYLRKLLKECEDKNRLLEENNSLLREKIEFLESKQVKSVADGKKLNKKSFASASFSQVIEGAERDNTPASAEIKRGNRRISNDCGKNAEVFDDVCSKDVKLSVSESQRRSVCARGSSSDDPAEVNDSLDAGKQTEQNLQRDRRTDPTGATGDHLASRAAVDPKNAGERGQSGTSAWTRVARRRGRNRVENGAGDDRPKPLRGTLEGAAGLAVAEDYAWLFVSGLAPETEPQQIQDYLMENGFKGKCVCTKMKTRRDKYRSSFKLAVPRDVSGRIMSGALWPKGVLVNHFLNIQCHRSLQS